MIIEMNRYSEIKNKIKREIVLLKSSPCRWGKCSFCDYIDDNSIDQAANHRLNMEVLNNVTGKYGVLEIINSGNIFELPQNTLNEIKMIIKEKSINLIFFESHWIYKDKIKIMKDFFGIKCIVKTGLETFDRRFREEVLLKGFDFNSITELQSFFDSVCLMVGIKGQSKSSIKKDIDIAMENFKHFTINVYVANSTDIKPDLELIKWFQEEFKWLDHEQKCDVLWVNTDFGVGE